MSIYPNFVWARRIVYPLRTNPFPRGSREASLYPTARRLADICLRTKSEGDPSGELTNEVRDLRLRVASGDLTNAEASWILGVMDTICANPPGRTLTYPRLPGVLPRNPWLVNYVQAPEEVPVAVVPFVAPSWPTKLPWPETKLPWPVGRPWPVNTLPWPETKLPWPTSASSFMDPTNLSPGQEVVVYSPGPFSYLSGGAR